MILYLLIFPSFDLYSFTFPRSMLFVRLLSHEDFSPKKSVTSCNISIAPCKPSTVYSSSTNTEATTVLPANCCLSSSPPPPSH